MAGFEMCTEERRAPHAEAVAYVEARCVNARQHRIVLDDRLVDVPDTENVERTEFVVDNRPHRLPGEPGHMSLPREPDPTPVLAAPKFVVTITFELWIAA